MKKETDYRSITIDQAMVCRKDRVTLKTESHKLITRTPQYYQIVNDEGTLKILSYFELTSEDDRHRANGITDEDIEIEDTGGME